MTTILLFYVCFFIKIMHITCECSLYGDLIMCGTRRVVWDLLCGDQESDCYIITLL